MTREALPARRHTWRQKVRIIDQVSGTHLFYVDFGEYEDGRLAEIFITSHKTGSFARGTLDALARSASLALQSGTAPHALAKTLMGMDYPPGGVIDAEGSWLNSQKCSSIADYIGQEIMVSYDHNGRRKDTVEVKEKVAGTDSTKWLGI